MSERMTSRQADAKDRRNRMTRQRQELSNKIRKQKKSEYLARKRNVGPTNATYSSSEASIRELFQLYIKNATEGALKALEKSLPSKTMTTSEEKPLLYLSKEEEPGAVQFLERLKYQAVSERKLLTTCLNILVKLTSISFNIISEDSYYGQTPNSWCTLIIENAELSQLILKYTQNYTSCLVILGNMVGDPSSSRICPALRQIGMVPILVACIQQAEASWALTNAIRNDKTAWASAYCSDELVSAQLLESLLMSPSVSTQAAWMIASLTGREEEVVQYLVSRPSFCPTLVACLERSTSTQQQIALLQALGSIACFEPYISPLLNQTPLIGILCGILDSQRNQEVMLKAIWLSGCLLVDARIQDHPSTSIAAPRLVPIMFGRLGSEGLRLEEKRDITYALRAALEMPPEIDLNENLRIPPLVLPDREVVRSSLSTLVKLITSPDVDAAIDSVMLINVMLRQDESLKVYMEEEDIIDALERFCDEQHDDPAEVAANMLDDFFYADDDLSLDEAFLIQNSTNAFGQSGFGFPDPSRQGGLGRGRGRGATIPSWMPKN